MKRGGVEGIIHWCKITEQVAKLELKPRLWDGQEPALSPCPEFPLPPKCLKDAGTKLSITKRLRMLSHKEPPAKPPKASMGGQVLGNALQL